MSTTPPIVKTLFNFCSLFDETNQKNEPFHKRRHQPIQIANTFAANSIENANKMPTYLKWTALKWVLVKGLECICVVDEQI